MSDKKIKNKIVQYFHCKQCLENHKTPNVAVGYTEKGIQVWCDNCHINIASFDFLGQKIGYAN